MQERAFEVSEPTTARDSEGQDEFSHTDTVPERASAFQERAGGRRLSKSGRRYSLGGLEFRTKEAVAAKAKEILWESTVSQRFALESAEHRFLRDLIEGHPDAAEKIGSGIEAFSVTVTNFFRGAGRGDRQFNLHRVDGSTDNFSYKKCLQAATHRQKCLEAFRNAIRTK